MQPMLADKVETIDRGWASSTVQAGGLRIRQTNQRTDLRELVHTQSSRWGKCMMAFAVVCDNGTKVVTKIYLDCPHVHKALS